MSDAEKVWRGKTDEEVLAAARRLAEYTEGVNAPYVRRSSDGA
jgi:hypothetical protein